MSRHAPAHVAAAAAAGTGPQLLYDRWAIAARLDAIAAIARRHGVVAVAAAKALPTDEVAALAAARLDGLDLAGPDEDRLAGGARALSLTYPGGVDAARLAALVGAGRRVIVTGESAAQLVAAAAVPGVELAARVSTSALGEAAPGGLRTVDGHVSRFGLDRSELAALPAAVRDRVRGLHAHGGPLATSPSTLARRAAGLIELGAEAGLALERVDLGGGLHGFTLDAPTAGQFTLDAAVAAARAAVPSTIELWLEPGRLVCEGAGYAAATVLAARTVESLAVRVLELSRLCHLRWSTPRLCAPPPPAGAGQRVALVGATCCEDDVIADARVPSLAPLEPGQRAVLAEVSGYAATWNRGFAGVSAATVTLVA